MTNEYVESIEKRLMEVEEKYNKLSGYFRFKVVFKEYSENKTENKTDECVAQGVGQYVDTPKGCSDDKNIAEFSKVAFPRFNDHYTIFVIFNFATYMKEKFQRKLATISKRKVNEVDGWVIKWEIHENNDRLSYPPAACPEEYLEGYQKNGEILELFFNKLGLNGYDEYDLKNDKDSWQLF
jgi:hypothetical protein